MASTKIINVLKDDSFDEILGLFQNTSSDDVIFILPKRSKSLSTEDHFATLSGEAENQGKRVSIMSPNPEIQTLGRKYNFEILASKTSSRTNGAKKAVVAARHIPPHGDDSLIIRNDNDVFTSDDEDGVIKTSDEQDVTGDKDDEELPDGMHEEVVEEAEEPLEEPSEEELGKVEEEELDPELVAAKNGKYVAQTADQRLRGIDGVRIQSGDRKSVRVKDTRERPVSLGITKNSSTDNDIESVWGKKDEIWGAPLHSSRKSLWSWLFHRNPQTVLPGARRTWSRASKMVGGLVALSLVVGAIFVALPSKATVTIKPTEKKLDLELTASTADTFTTIDPLFMKLPGQLFSVDRTVTQEFTATGEKEVAQKSRGKVTLYNEYGTTPQTLIATTRLETPQGLIFRTLRSVNVPGTRVENGKVIAGTMEVEVIADKPGDTYNVPAGKFVIPAFREKGDQDRLNKIYATSTEAFTGGVSGKAKVVTEADYNKAKDEITKKLKEEVTEVLRSEASGLKILEEAISVTVKEVKSSAEIDQAAETFTMTANGNTKTVGFKENDLNSLLGQYIEERHKLKIIPEKAGIKFTDFEFSEVKNILSLGIKLDGVGYELIPEEKIISDLLGKSEEEIRDYLKGAENVGTAKVVLSPFWSSRMTTDRERVTFKITYE